MRMPQVAKRWMRMEEIRCVVRPRLTVWNRIFMNLEPNLLIYENTNYIGLKLGLNRYNFRVGFWILGKNRPERSV